MSSVNNIPEGWVETTLENLTVKIGSGATPRGGADSYKEQGISLIRSQNILDFDFSYGGLAFIDEKQAERLSNVTLEQNDVLINITGDSVARVCIVPSQVLPARVNQHVAIIRTDSEKLDNHFLLYYLLAPNFKRYLIQIASNGATRNALTKSNLENLIIKAPIDLLEQKAIAQVLTAFDDKIENLRAQNETLEQIAQIIFKEWFGKYQLSEDIPEGWHTKKVGAFISSSIGGDYGKEEITGDFNQETMCLRGTDLPDMKAGLPEKAPIRFLKSSKLERCQLANGDIVIEISGGTENQSTGRVMYINTEILNNVHLPMTCVNFCRILRPLKVEYSYFIYSLFDYLYSRRVMFNWENGTTGIKNLNLKALLETFEVVIPKTTDKIIEFDKLVKSSFVKIQTNNKQIQSLTRTRDTLLPKLMRGELRVEGFKR